MSPHFLLIEFSRNKGHGISDISLTTMQGGCNVTFKQDLRSSFQENCPVCLAVITEMYVCLYACMSLHVLASHALSYNANFSFTEHHDFFLVTY